VTSDLFHQWLSSTPRSPGGAASGQCSLGVGLVGGVGGVGVGGVGVGGVTFSANPPTVFASSGDACDDVTNEDASKSLEVLDPNDRLIELILDISNELDINVLCHKILLNVGYLTQADKCSLFLARGPRDKRYLEAKLFDVDATTSKSIMIPI